MSNAIANHSKHGCWPKRSLLSLGDDDQPLRAGRNRADPINKETTIIPGTMKSDTRRAFIEIGFIVFLFYSNLLMGEFEHSGIGQTRGLISALSDMFTAYNLGIAIAAATIGYILIEFLRTKF
jgi:hypothetical protein